MRGGLLLVGGWGGIKLVDLVQSNYHSFFGFFFFGVGDDVAVVEEAFFFFFFGDFCVSEV